jgi:hypothetical protein
MVLSTTTLTDVTVPMSRKVANVVVTVELVVVEIVVVEVGKVEEAAENAENRQILLEPMHERIKW